jgi:CDP-glucose 4,6-dehydratase
VKVFITGHTGFKGSWFSVMLKERGYLLAGLSDKYLSDSLYNLANLRDLYEQEFFADIRDLDAIENAVQIFKPDLVFHFAAQPLVRDSYSSPHETFEVNVIGTLNVLEALRKYSCQLPAVIVTTDKVYKNFGKDSGYVEEDELGGSDPYSASKSAADILTQSYISSFGMNRTAIVRAGNVIGGGDWSKDRLVPDLIRSLIAKIPAVIRFPDATRPWQHVLDCLSGYLLLSDRLIKGECSGAWNFGPRQAESRRKVREVVDLVLSMWDGQNTWITDRGSNAKEAHLLELDSSKARRELEWDDAMHFEKAIQMTVDFYKRALTGEQTIEIMKSQLNEFKRL